jgi:serine/threonine protein kinase
MDRSNDPDATLPLPRGTTVRRAGVDSLREGQLLGPWRLEALAGEGSFGRVFRARHTTSGHVRAVKLLHAALAGTTEAVCSFLEEARLSARIAHPAVVSAEGVWTGGEGTPSWSVSRWVEGSALAAVLRRGPLPLAQALWTGLGLCSALAAVHAAGVVHGDCKPDNVLLASDGGVHLVDFGSAWELGRSPRTVQGTPAYLAPETWADVPLDGRVDLYAFGCVLFSLLTGRPPFVAAETGALLELHRSAAPPPLPTRMASGEWIPVQLRALVRACLAKSPGGRPSSAREVAGILARLPSCRG